MFNRRSFLQAGAIAAGGYFLSEGEVFGEEAEKNKAVIFIWLHGGISNVDFLNPITSGPDKYRSIDGELFGDSFTVGGHFKNISKITNKITNVRSFRHSDNNHLSATHYVMTGYPNFTGGEGSPQKEPAYGSIISTTKNPINKMPIYVKVNKIAYDSSAWVGAKHTGFEVDGDGVKNLASNLDKQRYDARMEMVRSFDRKDDQLFRSWSQLRDEAYNISVGNASKAFKIDEESEYHKNLYNISKSSFGRSLLQAKRLIKHGTRFVTVSTGSWDNHVDIKKAFDDRAPELDYCIYTLINDLEQDGTLDSTLIILTSDFSRSAKNSTFGKDHNSRSTTLAFAGGGFNHGKAVGETTKDGLEAIGNVYYPKDLSHTILKFFDIPESTTLISPDKRPMHLYQSESRNILG